ncbi:MAG: TadE/TadG family type IV pilus assembly protein [Nitrospirota bacterium]|nr:TadE/TadG family type IV pilus assembly protein [Nitrospirota bacterium]
MKQLRTNSRGVATVEAAMTLLLFITLIFAIVEAGRFLNVQQVLTNAAREGARLSIAPLSGTSSLASVAEIEARVQSFLDSAAIQGAQISVVRPVYVATTIVQGEFTRVEVSLPYRVMTLPLFSALEITLQGKALMRNETSP